MRDISLDEQLSSLESETIMFCYDVFSESIKFPFLGYLR